MVVLDEGTGVGQSSNLVEMSGEESETFRCLGQVLSDGPSDAATFVGLLFKVYDN